MIHTSACTSIPAHWSTHSAQNQNNCTTKCTSLWTFAKKDIFGFQAIYHWEFLVYEYCFVFSPVTGITFFLAYPTCARAATPASKHRCWRTLMRARRISTFRPLFVWQKQMFISCWRWEARKSVWISQLGSWLKRGGFHEDKTGQHACKQKNLQKEILAYVDANRF